MQIIIDELTRIRALALLHDEHHEESHMNCDLQCWNDSRELVDRITELRSQLEVENAIKAR